MAWQHAIRVGVLLLAAGLVSPGLAGGGPPDAAGVAVHHENGGERSVAPDAGGSRTLPPAPPSAQAGSVAFVDRDHRSAVSRQVEISADGGTGFASWWLNNERVAKYDPHDGRVWEHPGEPYALEHALAVDAGASIATAAYREVGAIGELLPPTQGAKIVGWPGADGPDPLLEREQPLCAQLVCRVAAVASDDGLVAIATHQTAGERGLVVLYGPGPALLPLWAAQFDATGSSSALTLEGVDLSADGSTIVVSTYNKVSVFRLPLPFPVLEVPNNSQTPARVSGDGTYIALGGFSSSARLYAWDGATYEQEWSRNVGHPWVTAVAVADDGTVVAGTFNYVGGNSGKAIGLHPANGATLWECHCYGDYVDDVEITPDGSRAVAVSWGSLGGPGGDVLTAFDATNGAVLHRLLSGVDEPGSLHSVAISDDGHHILAGGKAVHARTFGNGGQVYGIELP